MNELQSIGLTVADIRKALLKGGDVSLLAGVLKQALGNPPLAETLTPGLPLVLPPATALSQDSELAALARSWERGERPALGASENIRCQMFGIARYGPNTGAYIEEIIGKSEADIVVIDVPPSWLSAAMLYSFGPAAAVGLPVQIDLRGLSDGQLYTSEVIIPGGACQAAITRCWLDKIPLVPAGVSSRPGKARMEISGDEMPQPDVSEIYRAFDGLLKEERTGDTSLVEQNRRICARLAPWLRGEMSGRQIEEAGHIASRIADIAWWAAGAGKQLNILALVDVRNYENASYALDLLQKGITSEVYVRPGKDLPECVVFSSCPDTAIAEAAPFTPATTPAQELFRAALEDYSRTRETEALPAAEIDELITAITGRTRHHPSISRGASVRGAIALKEVLQAYGEIDGGFTRYNLRNAAIVTLAPRIVPREGAAESAEEIIDDIVKEALYDISFSRRAFRSELLDELDWLTPRDMMEAFQNLDFSGQAPSGQEAEEVGRKITSISEPGPGDLDGLPSQEGPQQSGPGNEHALSTARAMQYLMDRLEEKYASGAIGREEYLREKQKLQSMLDAANFLSTQEAGREMARTVYELMDAQDKHWGKKLNFEDMHVYYHIKGTSEKEDLSPAKQGYYRLRVLIDTLEKGGLLKEAVKDKSFSLTAEALTVLLEMMLPKSRKGRELADVLTGGKTAPSDYKYDVQRYSPGNVFRDISVRHTLRQIARRRRKPHEIQRQDLRVFIRRPRKLQSDIVLCLDTSGSMGYRHKLTFARLAAASLVKTALERGDRVGIIDFDDLGKTVLQLTDNKSRLMEGIAQVNAGGNTNIGDGIETAARMLLRHPSQNEKHIILITDGLPSAVSRDALDKLGDPSGKDLTEEYAILETRSAARKGIRTSVIYIEDEIGAGENFVNAIARAGDGQVTRVNQPADLRLAVA